MSRPAGLGKWVGLYLSLGYTLDEARVLAIRRSSNESIKRRYRSDPTFRRRRIARALENYRRRKIENLKLCGFCRARRSICNVTRTQIRGGAYEKIRIPYCGQC